MERMRYAFIGSAPGSGSTLVASLLALHPELLSLTELGLYAGNRSHIRDYILSGRSCVTMEPTIWDNPLSTSRVKRIARSCELSYQEGARQMAAYTGRDIKATADKHPVLTPWMKDIGESGVQLIYLHRHPLAVVNSILKKFKKAEDPEDWLHGRTCGNNWGIAINDNPDTLLRQAAFQVLAALQGLGRAKTAGLDVLELQYESLLRRPVDVLNVLWGTMGLAPLPNILLDDLMEEHLTTGRSGGYEQELRDLGLYDEAVSALHGLGVTWE